MPRPGQKSVTVGGKTLKQLEGAYYKAKEKHPKLSFASFISETALLELERQNILQRSQYFSVIGFQENCLYIKDVKKNRIIGIYLNDGNLTCDVHKRNDCIHVGFAHALPEVSKRLRSS